MASVHKSDNIRVLERQTIKELKNKIVFSNGMNNFLKKINNIFDELKIIRDDANFTNLIETMV